MGKVSARHRMIGLNPQCRLIVPDRFFKTTFPRQQQAEMHMRIRIVGLIRLHAQRFGKRDFCLLPPPLRGIHVAKIVIRIRVIGL